MSWRRVNYILFSYCFNFFSTYTVSDLWPNLFLRVAYLVMPLNVALLMGFSVSFYNFLLLHGIPLYSFLVVFHLVNLDQNAHLNYWISLPSLISVTFAYDWSAYLQVFGQDTSTWRFKRCACGATHCCNGILFFCQFFSSIL